MNISRNTLPVLLLLFGVLFLFSGFSEEDLLGKLEKRLSDIYDKYPREKIYIHTSRDIYVTGEKIWFNAWLVNAADNKPSRKSSIIFVQLYDIENRKIIERRKIALEESLASNYLEMPKDLHSGNYEIQAYTRWMLNFDQKLIFKKQITVFDSEDNTFELSRQIGKKELVITPEGGRLVTGLTSKVAYEFRDFINEQKHLKGHIIDDKHDTIISFNNFDEKIGVFTLKPEKDRKYFAVYQQDDKTFKIPIEISKEGSILSLDRTNEWVSLKLQNSVKTTGVYSIAFLSGRGICFKTRVNFEKSLLGSVNVPKNKLPAGLIQIVVFNPEGEIVNQRLFFNEKESVFPQIRNYGYLNNRRDHINFSLGMSGMLTYKSHYGISTYIKSDLLLTIQKETLPSYLLLNSELSEKIPNPTQFIKLDNNKPKYEKLDHLLYSRHLIAFSKEILDKESEITIRYQPKKSKRLFGRVNLKTGNPIPDSTMISFYFLKKEESIQSLVSSNGDFSCYALYGLSDDDNLKITVVDKNYKELDAEVHIETWNQFIPKEKTPKHNTIISLNKKQNEALVQLMKRSKIIHEYAPYSMRENREKAFRKMEYYEADYSIKLDEYVSFTTMEDVFRELLPRVLLRNNKGKYKIKIFSDETKRYLDNAPLVLIDNIPIKDINFLATIDPGKIEQIKLFSTIKVRNHIGICGFGGVLVFNTKPNKEIKDLHAHNVAVALEVTHESENYTFPNYAYNKKLHSRIPDFRQPIYQEVGVIKPFGHKQITFYASDEVGRYVLLVQGVTKEGELFYREKSFKIKPGVSN